MQPAQKATKYISDGLAAYNLPTICLPPNLTQVIGKSNGTPEGSLWGMLVTSIHTQRLAVPCEVEKSAARSPSAAPDGRHACAGHWLCEGHADDVASHQTGYRADQLRPARPRNSVRSAVDKLAATLLG